MLIKRRPISVAEAVKKVMEHPLPNEVEFVSIIESNGRFLGEDIFATMDLPRFTRSSFDGYALRVTDSVKASPENPIEFEVLGDLGAGSVFSKKVGVFQTLRIMTGAQIPENCDGVIPIELVQEVERDNKRYAIIKREIKKGEHISYQGEEAKQGDKLITKGTRLNAGAVAILATFGIDKIPVAKKPRVGILASGSELLEMDEKIAEGKIRNSNAYMTISQIKRIGGDPVYFGKLEDFFESSFKKIQSVMEQVDIVVTTGGVSVGDFDLMPDIYMALGAEILFNKVSMRPGSVTTVAHKNGKLLFGLSGNPSACFVGLELFLRPVLRAQMFNKKPHMRKEQAILDVDFPKPDSFDRFVRSNLFFERSLLKVRPCGIDKSNIVTSLVRTNCLMLLPGGSRGFLKGETVDIFLLEDDEGGVSPWTY